MNFPLVSVVICTYNSGPYIIDALDSVRNQKYPNIELIITDDCSKDETVSICKEWISCNKEYFVDCQIIVTKVNTGVSGNLNRGLKECKGEWVKSFAGDDKLVPNCIGDNVSYIQSHPDTTVLFSNMQMFGDVDELNRHININCHYFELDKKKFRERLYFMNFLPAPTLFIKADVFKRHGYYDESIPMMEDWPYWMKLAHEGVNFSYMNTITVLYRVHESISVSKLPNPKFVESQKKTRKLSYKYAKEVSPILSFYIRTFYYNSPNKVLKLFKWLLLMANPYYYYFKKIESKINVANH